MINWIIRKFILLKFKKNKKNKEVKRNLKKDCVKIINILAKRVVEKTK